jgi:biopolymer transport protein ExbB/TolQ
MMDALKAGGPFMFPLILIALVVGVLAARLLWRVRRDALPAGQESRLALQALPFWGGTALLIGLLGQAAGLYKILGVFAEAEYVDARYIFIGLRESMTTTLVGLAICIAAAIAWLALRHWANGRATFSQ